MTEACNEPAHLTASVRELRLVVERTLLLTGLPRGLIPAVREAVLRSEAMGLGGLALLRHRFETLGRHDPAGVTMRDVAGGGVLVDARELPAWVIGPALLDLAIARARRRPGAVVLVRGIGDREELRVAETLCLMQGARAVTGAPALEAVPDRMDAETAIACTETGMPALVPDPALERALQRGFRVEGGLWWALHHLSNRALTPDSMLSRRHAGPIILEPDGSVTGRLDTDDDTDLGLLGAGVAAMSESSTVAAPAFRCRGLPGRSEREES